MSEPRTAIVLGGYGLIGAACVRALQRHGFRVVGVGRDRRAAEASAPNIDWRIADISAASVGEWRELLAEAEVVVNAAGALQSGARDDVEAIHVTAIERITTALAGRKVRFVQISAAGISETASTAFFRTKAKGDGVLIASQLNWVILRPTLVLAPAAYGGTALLRASAAMPIFGLLVAPSSLVATVFIDDVAAAVVAATCDDIPSRTIADLTESESRPFADLVRAIRAWLGFRPWSLTCNVPSPLVRYVARIADGLGWLGWRSPMRTTAITVLAEGVGGDPAAWRAAGGSPCRPLRETLAAMPATMQDRWFARLYLTLPLIIGTLALFWTASGLIGLWQKPAAIDVLLTRGASPALAEAAVLLGALTDIVLGVSILVRRFARGAAIAMIVVSLAYLAGATLLAADLWADPLGPLLKVLPALMLALVAAAILDER